MEKAGLGGDGGESLLACLLARSLPSCLPSQSSSSTARAAARLQYTAISAVIPLPLQSLFPARITFPPLPNPDM